MCGIFGLSVLDRITTDDHALVETALENLSHRGPDDSGIYTIDNKIIFGHRRLAILDTSTNSTQPFRHKHLTLTYNGEIYNYIELRERLISLGHQFETTGDTEVLIKAWAEWGPKALDFLDGMYAFALYDGKSLHLVTDTFGEKPLFYATTRRGFYFASESQALINGLNLAFEPTQEEAATFMLLGFLPAPHTGYKNLFAVPKNTHLVIENNRIKSQRQVWTFPETYTRRGTAPRLTEQDLDQIESSLGESIQTRLRSDRKLGVFLSSGVDSSLIAAMSVNYFNQPMAAYTIAFDGAFDESSAANQIAKYLKLDHHIIDFDADNFAVTGENVRSLHGNPLDSLSTHAVLNLSQEASKELTVVLSGTGGDELFFGYNKYHTLHRRQWLYSTFRKLYPLFAPFNPVLSHSNKWRKAREQLLGDENILFLTLKNNGLRKEVEYLYALSAENGQLLEHDNTNNLALQVRTFDLHNTLPYRYIPAIERPSMRASIEVRNPLLSKDLLTCISKYDTRAFLKDGPKSVLKRIAYRHIPQTLLDHPKRGFSYPQAKFIANTLQEKPALPLIPEALKNTLWHEKSNPRFYTMLIRASVLSMHS